MRSRCAILIALVLGVMFVAGPARPSTDRVFAQQDTTQDSETEGETGGGGQSDPEAETGSEEADTAEAATETGPPWTYQMARMGIVLSILLGLAIARWYYKLVASRQKGAA